MYELNYFESKLNALEAFEEGEFVLMEAASK